MRVSILKSFLFSRDGITSLQAVAGSADDIPDRLISGLRREGFVGETPTVTAPENTMLFPGEAAQEQPAAPLDLSPVTEVRDDVPQRDRRRRGK